MKLAVLLYYQLLVGALTYGLYVSVQDARRRGQSPLLVCVITVLLFPAGTIAWLIFRPALNKPDRNSKSFHSEDYRVQ